VKNGQKSEKKGRKQEIKRQILGKRWVKKGYI
jgi:hypothetical protein